MTNGNTFDKFVKDSLQDFKSPVSEDLWDKIIENNRLKKESPFWKNKYFLSSILVVLFISTSLVFYNYYFNINNSNSLPVCNNSIVNKSGSVYLEIKDETKKHSIINRNASTFTSLTSNVDKSVLNSTEMSNYKLAKSKVLIVSNKTSNLSLELKSKDISKQTYMTAISQKSNLTINCHEKRDRVNCYKRLEALKVHQSQPVSNSSLAYTNKCNIAKRDLALVSKDVLINISSLKTLPSSDLETNHFRKGELVSFLQPLNDDALRSKEILIKQNNLTVINVPDVQNKKWFISFYASPDFNTKNIQNTTSTNTFSKLQDSTQRITNGITTGAELTRTFGNQWKFKTGLQFKQVNERFFYIQNNATKNVSVTTNRSYINNWGTTIYTIDTTYYQQSGSTIKTIFNSYKSVELPLIMGYECRINKFSIAVNSGVITTLATFYEGKTNANSQSIVPLAASHTNGFYRSVPSFSLYGSAELIYPLGFNLDIFAEPYFRNGLTYNNVSSVGYNKKYNTAGVFFGIRYSFFSTGNKNN